MGGHAVVTGAAGFMGGHLVHALAMRGGQVRAVDVRPDPGRVRLRTVRYVCADIRNSAALQPSLEGAGTVYHLASVRLNGSQKRLCREVNVEAAWGLAESCAAAGVRRMIHVSTVGVYGHVTNPPAREDAPTDLVHVYERTRLEGELAVARSAAATGLELIVLRFPWVYGPGCPHMNRLLGSLKGGRFFYVGEGQNLRHPIYVSDAIEALLLAGSAPSGLAGRTYNIAGPRFMPLSELVDACARAVGVASPRLRLPREVVLGLGHMAEVAWGAARRAPPLSRRNLLFFEHDNAYDTTAARRDLGFEPRVDLEAGVRHTARGPLQLIGT
jgi:nucleoside-diphosphate-sugar epimerase